MSVVDDVRKAMQDFLAPELGELKVRIEALEKRMEIGFKTVDESFDALGAHIDQRFNNLEQMLQLSQRVARLEERDSQKAKEQ